MVDKHADEKRDDGRADQMEPGACLERFQQLRNRGNHQRQRTAGQQFCDGFHENLLLKACVFPFAAL